jgi:Ca-activated chloride channel family protein
MDPADIHSGSRRYLAKICLCVSLWLSGLFAQGIMVEPETGQLVAVNLEAHDVTVLVTGMTASYDVSQAVRSRNDAALEGVFYFALPKDLVISNVIATVDGASVDSNILKTEEVHRLMQKMLVNGGPSALLNMIDYDVLACRITSIVPRSDRTFRIKYTQYLQDDAGFIKLQYPVWSSLWQQIDDHAADVKQALTVSLQSEYFVKHIYSPSHAIALDYDGLKKATVRTRLAEQEATDFVLFHSQSQDLVSASLLTHKLNTDEYGYFLLMYSTPPVLPVNKMLAKDIIFVLDISRSMEGPKLVHARAALQAMIAKLERDDFFNIIAFNSESKLFSKQLVRANEHKEDAIRFVNRLRADGGSNIHEALLTALAHKSASGGARSIVFVTDGKPTVGLNDREEIFKTVKAMNKTKYRIFTFGIGYEVDTILLDGISNENYANAQYIEPDQKIENELAQFYERTGYPYLTSLQLKFRDVEIADVYPETLPELTTGAPLVILGRFKGEERGVVEFSGRSRQGISSFESELRLPAIAEHNDFLATVWATRKMGHSLEALRLRGDVEEDEEAVLQLTESYALLTPVSAFMLRDSQKSQSDSILPAVRARFDDNKSYLAGHRFATALDGRPAVQASNLTRRMKNAVSVADQPASEIRRVRRRNFVYDHASYWVDWQFKPDYETLHIRYASNAYFQLLQSYPGVACYVALGSQVIFKCENEFVQIDDQGAEELTAEMLRNLLSQLLTTPPSGAAN